MRHNLRISVTMPSQVSWSFSYISFERRIVTLPDTISHLLNIEFSEVCLQNFNVSEL